MSHSIPLKALTILLALLALGGCSQNKTSIELAWRNPGFEDVFFEKLFVIGVGRDDGARRLFEDTFAKTLEAQGTEAQPSWKVLPQTEQLTQEQIRNAIDGGGFDGVLVTRLLSIDQDQEYVPPKSYTVPTTYYGYGYYGYYGTSYATVHEPGYFETHTTFRLETNLYSVATGGLVWSGQTETLDPDSLTEVIDSVTAAVARELKEEQLIR